MNTSKTLSLSALLGAPTMPTITPAKPAPVLMERYRIYRYYPGDGTEIIWDVTKALALIAARPREAARFAPQEQGVTLSQIRERAHELNVPHAMTTDITVPVLFVPYEGACQMIDGWHRLYRAVSEGVTEIRAYVLTQEEADAVRIR